MSGIGMLSRLAPSSSQMEPRVDGGWVAEINMENLAGILGKMTADQSAIVRVLVLNDARSYRHVLSKVRGMLLSSLLSMDEQEALGKIIVQSVVMPSLCETCQGHAQHMRESLVISCPDCGGTGHRHVMGHEHGMNEGIRDWHRFERDYERCCDTLRGWISGAGHIWSHEMNEEC